MYRIFDTSFKVLLRLINTWVKMKYLKVIPEKYLLWSTFWIYSMKMLLKYFCPQVHTIDESSSSWVQSVWWLSESILFYDRYYFFLLKHTNIPSQPNNSRKNNTGMWEWERRCNLMKLGNLFSQVNKKGRELSKRIFHSYLWTLTCNKFIHKNCLSDTCTNFFRFCN